MRYSYGYSQVSQLVGDGVSGTLPWATLTTITVPSPTGTGTSTATINYNSIKRVSSSVGEGSMAVAFVHQYLAR